MRELFVRFINKREQSHLTLGPGGLVWRLLTSKLRRGMIFVPVTTLIMFDSLIRDIKSRREAAGGQGQLFK